MLVWKAMVGKAVFGTVFGGCLSSAAMAVVRLPRSAGVCADRQPGQTRRDSTTHITAAGRWNFMIASVVSRLAIAVAVVTVARHDTPLVNPLDHLAGRIVRIPDIVAIRIPHHRNPVKTVVGVHRRLGT